MSVNDLLHRFFATRRQFVHIEVRLICCLLALTAELNLERIPNSEIYHILELLQRILVKNKDMNEHKII